MTDIRHGYTLDDIHELARRSVIFNLQWFRAGDRRDQYEAAWHGIVEHLYTSDEAPSVHDLHQAGALAISADIRADMQARGTRRDGTNTGANFGRYWGWHGIPAASPETAVVERVAIGQVMAAITSRQREAFGVLAATEDYHRAAEVLGIEPQTYRALIGRARKAVDEFWYGDETPPKRRQDRRVAARPAVDERDAAARARYAAAARARRWEAA